MVLFKSLLRQEKLILFLLISVFTFIYGLLAIIRHNNFGSFAYDLGLYDQAIWLYSQFKIPLSTVKVPNMILLGDHFAPSLALLSPLLWIVDDVRILLFAQAAIVVLGVYPVFRLASKIIKNQFFAFALSLSYLTFYSVQNALSFDIHTITFAAGLLPWLYYFLEEKRYKLYWLFFFILLGLKEDVPVLLFGIGAFSFFEHKKKKLGIISMAVSLAYFFIVTKFAIPSISGVFRHESSLPSSLSEWLTFLFYPFVKIKTLFFSFVSFLFLPLLSFPAMIPVILHFVEHFLDKEFTGRFEMALHYRVPLAPLLAVAAIYGLVNLQKRIKNKNLPNFIATGLLTVLFINQFFLHLPLNSLFKRDFYQSKPWMDDIRTTIKKIPPQASITTQNNIVPHLSHRDQIYLASVTFKNCQNGELCRRLLYENADYVLLDLHEGQPVNNFWGEKIETIKEVMENEDRLGFYKMEDKNNNVFLYSKKK